MALTPEQIQKYRSQYGIGTSTPPVATSPGPGVIRETAGDLKSAYLNAGERLNATGENVVARATDPKQSVAEKVVGTGADIFRGIGRFIGGGAVDLAKTAVSQSTEDKVASVVEGAGARVAQTEPAQALMQKYQSLDPKTRAQVDNILGYAEGAAELLGGGAGVRGFKAGTKATIEAGGVAATTVNNARRSLFTRPAATADEVIAQADDALRVSANQTNPQLQKLVAEGRVSEARALAESTAPKVSLKEKWVNLRPDIKQRIQGKPELLKEYFDVTHARNANDTVPSVYEHGGSYAHKAVDVMDQKLQQTGGDIGKIRTKLGTYKAAQGDIEGIEKSFLGELKQLNLRIRNGVVEPMPGTVTKTAAKGDLSALNELYKDIRATKQSPTLTRLIELRSQFDKKINFGKSSREVSSSVDPLSKKIRTDIADTAARIVGKENAGDLKRYSDFMEAYDDLKGYTDRKAGGEYLLRLVLSGRGGEARQIVQTIKEHTGIDLMDHATMMQISNDLIGNDAQKNLFRQEMTKAGLDTAAMLKGDVGGAASTLFQKGVDKFMDPEKIYMDAARGATPPQTAPKPAPKPPTTKSQSVSSTQNTTKKGFIARAVDKYKSIPNKEGGFVKIGGRTFREIDEPTKREMVRLVDYLRITKGVDNRLEKDLDRIMLKYNIAPDWSNAKIANTLEDLLEKTKTRDRK